MTWQNIVKAVGKYSICTLFFTLWLDRLNFHVISCIYFNWTGRLGRFGWNTVWHLISLPDKGMTVLFLTLLFKLSDICVAFVQSWWNLWCFWSKLVKFVVKVDEIYDAFGDMWQNFWCSRSKLMKFLVFLVKLVKFVVLLVICRLCRGKNYGRTNPPKCGKCSALLGGKTFLFVHFVFMCIVTSYLSCIQLSFVLYSMNICNVFDSYLSRSSWNTLECGGMHFSLFFPNFPNCGKVIAQARG